MHDVIVVPVLIEKLQLSEFMIMDKGYDSESLRIQIEEKGSTPIIPKRKMQKLKIRI